MTVQEFWNSGISFLNLCSVYYVTQLLKCVQISFLVFALVFFLRKTLLKNRVILKGLLWSMFVPVLFVGKVKFFYENRIGIILFSWLAEICKIHVWVNWLYLGIVFVYAVRLFRKKRELKKLIAGMETRKVEETLVYVTKLPVTPAATGVFRPKIVMPEVILKEYDRAELQMILLHEKTHIRLGHLLFYFLWDVLRVLLWMNPLLMIGTDLFREDMEEICDLVTIRKSRGKVYDYGKLLLKSMKILQSESKGVYMSATFAENREYQKIRQRVTRIVGYKPYKGIVAAGAPVITALCVVAAIVWIRSVSYGRYNENDVMLAYGFDGKEVTFFDNGDALHQIISYDDEYVYVDREAFEKYLQKKGGSGDIFIVFGGFYKLPGIGGMGCSCYYAPGEGEQILKLPYENPVDDWRVKLVKML